MFTEAIFCNNQRNFLKGPLRLVSQLRKETNLTENCYEINKWLGPQFDEEKNTWILLSLTTEVSSAGTGGKLFEFSAEAGGRFCEFSDSSSSFFAFFAGLPRFFRFGWKKVWILLAFILI